MRLSAGLKCLAAQLINTQRQTLGFNLKVREAKQPPPPTGSYLYIGAFCAALMFWVLHLSRLLVLDSSLPRLLPQLIKIGWALRSSDSQFTTLHRRCLSVPCGEILILTLLICSFILHFLISDFPENKVSYLVCGKTVPVVSQFLFVLDAKFPSLITEVTIGHLVSMRTAGGGGRIFNSRRVRIERGLSCTGQVHSWPFVMHTVFCLGICLHPRRGH